MKWLLLLLLLAAGLLGCSKCEPRAADVKKAPSPVQEFTLADGTRCVSVIGKDVLVCDFSKPSY